MTDLVMRTFRANAGHQALVGYCLSGLASAMIRQVAATAVSIFCVENDPRCLVWLSDRGEEHDFARLPPFSGASLVSLSPYLAASSPGRRLRLVEEHHRRRPGPYQIWSVEVQAPDERGVDLRRDLEAARGDARLIGSALYQSVDDPAVVVLFLGLAWGVTPGGIGFSAARLGGASVSGTLTLVLDLRRLTWGAPSAPLPEWIREGRSRRPVIARAHSPVARNSRT